MGSGSCQKSELKHVFHDLKGCENLDYDVTAGLKEASEYFWEHQRKLLLLQQIPFAKGTGWRVVEDTTLRN